MYLLAGIVYFYFLKPIKLARLKLYLNRFKTHYLFSYVIEKQFGTFYGSKHSNLCDFFSAYFLGDLLFFSSLHCPVFCRGATELD